MTEPAKGVKAPEGHTGPLPWATLRSATAGPQAFRRMIDEVDPKARAGDLVMVYDRRGTPYGVALYNPKSLISLRLMTRETKDFDPDAFFLSRIKRAAEFRTNVLQLERSTNAYRLVHDLGDGLPGLIIDRYGDYFILDFYSLGMFKQADRLEKAIKAVFPKAQCIRRASQYTETMEGFRVPKSQPVKTKIQENGVIFEVDLAGGYKTGFFCDQRENRLALAAMAKGKRVLDVCSYTGGFGLYAKKVGGAEEVTCVELDEEVSALQQRNANINQIRIKAVCVDAFPYLRQAANNKETFDIVILDPYKFIGSQEGWQEGRQKYLDLNKLAFLVLAEGGILLTCSCSGMLPMEEFQSIVRSAAGFSGRQIQIFKKTGAGPDHPFAADFPEGEYLKAIWCRAL